MKGEMVGVGRKVSERVSVGSMVSKGERVGVGMRGR